MKKLVSILFVLSFLLVIASGFIKPVVYPKEVLLEENRFANKVPKISFKGFVDGTFQENMELALADQIPLSSKLKVLKKTIDVTLKGLYYNNTKDNTYNYISDGIYKYNDSLVYSKYDFDYIKPELDNRINDINAAFSKLDNVDLYVYFIEKDTDINFTDNSKLGAYEYLKGNLNNNIKAKKFSIDSYDDFNKYFYKVDHHWNYKGSYKGYLEVADMLGIESPISYTGDICLSSNLIGSKNSAIGGKFVFKEKFCAYTFDLPKYDIYFNSKKVNFYGDYKNLNIANPLEVYYGSYYGEDISELKIDNHNPDEENLLIIGESFDNAITELLASHFNITYNVDLRNYVKDLGHPFDIYSFVKDNNISKILLIGNVDYYIKDVFNLESGDQRAI